MAEHSISRKRPKPADTDMLSAAVGVEDSPCPQPSKSSSMKAPLSYISILQNAATPKAMEVEDLTFSDEDCVFSSGEHGLNLKFADNVLDAFDQGWQNAVIVHLMGKPNSVNSYDFILRGLRRKWKSHGGWRLIDLMNDYFIVKFDMESDVIEALTGGPWILAGQTLVVRRWKADFDARTDKISSMAVWVRIMGLPIRYFNRFAMSKIGKLLGDVVKIDSVTLLQERGKFARICVEINLDKPLQPVIEVDDIVYGIKYEGMSLLCFNCGIYGHSKDHCPSAAKSVVP